MGCVFLLIFCHYFIFCKQKVKKVLQFIKKSVYCNCSIDEQHLIINHPPR
nr:MAG TPA: hypothetical protein [Caudoviricetes sp.]